MAKNMAHIPASQLETQLSVVHWAARILWRCVAVVFAMTLLGDGLTRLLRLQSQAASIIVNGVFVSICLLPLLYIVILRPLATMAAEQAAAGAEARFRTVAQAMRDALNIFDARGTIRFANRASEEMMGYRPGELIGAKLETLIPEERREAFRSDLRAFASGEPTAIIGKGPVERISLRKNGERFPVELTWDKLPATGAEQETTFVVILREITARKQAEDVLRASERRFRELLESLPVAVRIVQEGKIVFVNAADARLHGFHSPEEALTLGASSYISEQDLARVTEYARRRSAGEEVPRHYEARRRRKDGSEFQAELDVERILLDGAPASLAVIRDLTDRKRIEMYEKLLPVCCVCGKIRDDADTAPGAGHWERFDQYLARHSDTQFSHTFCPECFEEYRKKNLLR